MVRLSGFSKGLIQGLAEGAEEVISKDIEEGKAQTRQLAKIRTERTIQRSDKREEEVKENFKKAQELAAKIGPGADLILKNYIKKGGMAYAEQATTNLLEVTKALGVSPAEYIGVNLAQHKKMPSFESLQALAQLSVSPIKEIEIADPKVGGFSKFFGVGGPEELRKLSESQIKTLGGVYEQDLTGLPQDVSLPNIDKALPIIRKTKEQTEFIMMQIQNIGDKLNDPSISEEVKTNLIQQELKLKNRLEGIGLLKKIAAGNTDVDPIGDFAYKANKFGVDSDEAKKALDIVKLVYGAKTTLKTDIKGTNLFTLVRADLDRNEKEYGGGKLGKVEFNTTTQKEVYLNPRQLKLAKLNRDIATLEFGIQMVANAANADAYALAQVNNEGGYKDRLIQLKEERRNMLQGSALNPTNTNATMEQGGAPPLGDIDRLVERYETSADMIRGAKLAIQRGVGSRTHTAMLEQIMRQRLTEDQAKTVIQRLATKN